MKNVLLITVLLSACGGSPVDSFAPDAGVDAAPSLCLYFGGKPVCGLEAGTSHLMNPIPPDVFFVTQDGKLGVTRRLPAFTWMSCRTFGAMLFDIYDQDWKDAPEVQIGDWASKKDWQDVPLPAGSFYEDWITTHPYPDVDSPTYQEPYGRCTYSP